MRGKVWAAVVWAATALMAATLAGAQTAPVAGSGTAGTAGTARRPMTFEDMMKMRRLGDIDVSPDGKWVLFSATDVNLEENTRTPHLWIVPVSGGAAERPLLAWNAGESRGRFSPDGKQILFESGRDGGQQIWLADFNGEDGTIGEPHELTHISTETDGAMWSPDGQHILFLSQVYPECSDHPSESTADSPGAPGAGPGPGIAPVGADEDACDKQKDEAQAESKVKAQIFTHLLYRHWNAFTDDKRSHLFLASVTDGSFRDLNPGDEHDVPPFSLGEPDGYAFSPDGKEIAFEEKKVDDPALSTSVAIYTLRLFDDAGKAEPNALPVKISTSAGGNFTPRYSPDGKWIAWRMQERAGYESDRFRLVVYDRAKGSDSAGSGAIREVLPNFDRWVDEEAWAPDSKEIYFAYGNAGEEPIAKVSLDGKAEILAFHGTYGDLHLTSDGQHLIGSHMNVRRPGEVVSLALSEPAHPGATVDSRPVRSGTEIGASGLDAPPAIETEVSESRLSHLNDSVLDQLELPEMQSFWFTSYGKVRVEGFVIQPPGFDAHKKYPVKFLIHGGPEGEWGDSWSYRWNPELFAANGYVVVMINPGGSVGYGQAFVDRVNGDWGGRPYIDLMRGLDYAEQHYPFIDKTRECALGASYGGYMADWILGHTDRFRCIVTHDGMFNTESAYGTTDELWFIEWEFKGTPWTNRALYRRWSPMLAETHF
ncbi:MAG TPA: S9 family peptidase, partial [Acidobacteriaceae bacterium]|nr:S9 family peptidase [Acidobacteriaceae bacterium]